MFLNLILASICIEKICGDEKILVIPVTTQISAQPLLKENIGMLLIGNNKMMYDH